MYVCACNAVTDRSVRGAVEDGACNLRGVARRCGAATECGGCRQAVQELLRSELDKQSQIHHSEHLAAGPGCNADGEATGRWKEAAVS